MRGDLGDFLADTGAVVGGGAALAATVRFLAGSGVHEFRPDADPDECARQLAVLRRPARLVRNHHSIVAVVTVLLAFALPCVARAGEWSDAEVYEVAAVLIVVICLIGGPWVDMAPDGALRRRARG